MLNFFIEDHSPCGSNQTNETITRIETEQTKSRKQTHDGVPSILKQTSISGHKNDNDVLLRIPNTPAVHFYPRATTNLSEYPANVKSRKSTIRENDQIPKESIFNRMFHSFPHSNGSDTNSQLEANGVSPISPAAMCTTEVLMLPDSNNVVFQGNQSHDAPTNQTKQENHGVAKSQSASTEIPVPAWLQHMNMVALMSTNEALSAQQNTSNGDIKSIHRTSLPSPATKNKQHPMYMYSTIAGMANSDALNAFNEENTFKNIDGNVQGSFSFTHDRSGVETNVASTPIHPALKKYIGVTWKNEAKEEPKEKREQRLARNRESARQSRRRKKELLLTLREKVNNLYEQLENERRSQLEKMEKTLLSEKESIILDIGSQFSDPRRIGATEKLIHLLQNEGPDTKSRLAVIEFQCRQLKRLFLPPYTHFLLHLSIKNLSFFTMAKESAQKQKELVDYNINSRISSRIVGEEIMKSYNDGKNNASDRKLSCHFTDENKMWPLFCHEMTVGIDQEEKLIEALESIQRNEQFEQMRMEIYKIIEMTRLSKQKLLESSPAIRKQNLSCLLQILTPSQTIRYLKWMTLNRERCKHLLVKESKITSSNTMNKLFEALYIKKRDV
jgi:hypothetical protein